MGNIVGSKSQILVLDLKTSSNKNSGKIIIRAEKVKEGNNYMWWQWSGLKIANVDGLFGKSDPFLRFYKKAINGDYLLTHESEVIKDNLNPIWAPFDISMMKLASSPEQLFRIECWDYENSGKHQFIGRAEISFKQIVEEKKVIFQLLDSQNKKKTGDLKLLQNNIIIKPSFMDFLRGGEQLNMMVAVDFTGSNGDPKLPTSLHSIRQDGVLNQYQSAILEVCDILLNYDYDKRVPVYGFGGKPHFPSYNKVAVDHCFPLTGNPQTPEVFGLDGIMQSYVGAIHQVQLSGPTLFGPIVRYATEISKCNESSNIYTVLLILTDGEINDFGETAQLIEQCKLLPISVIIIGVGNSSFGNMKALDGDENGSKKGRDLVQFVAFNEYKGNTALLAKEVLAELPNQLVQYKLGVGKKPNPPVMLSASQIQI